MDDDLIVRNGVLRNDIKQKVDLAIKDGKIAEISPKISGKDPTELDAGGNLVDCYQLTEMPKK